jgi:uncharacterized integral membrane protein
MKGARWIGLLLLVLLSGLFAYFNAGERTTLSLGFTTIYQVSLVRLVLGSFVLGMLAMFLVGLRQDMQLRRELRDRDRWGRHTGGVERSRHDPARDRWAAPAPTPPRLETD